MMVFMCYGLCHGDSCLEIMMGMVMVAVYVICLPITAILLTGANLILGDDNVVAKKLKDFELPIDMDMVTAFKLFEILGSIGAKYTYLILFIPFIG